MELIQSELQDMESMILASLNMIYSQDFELVERGGMERSLAFQFAQYFSEELKMTSNNWLSFLTVDMEYHKNGEMPKRTPRRPKGVRPDFILHNRGSNKMNALIVEFKGWWNRRSREDDIVKP